MTVNLSRDGPILRYSIVSEISQVVINYLLSKSLCLQSIILKSYTFMDRSTGSTYDIITLVGSRASTTLMGTLFSIIS